MMLAIVLCAICALIAIDIAGSGMMDSADEREVYRIRDENPNVYILAYMIVHLRKYPDPRIPVWHPPKGKECVPYPHATDSTFLPR